MNPLRERALERFAAPQDPIEMATFSSTRIACEYCQVGGSLGRKVGARSSPRGGNRLARSYTT
jgi:hypothetical protein